MPQSAVPSTVKPKPSKILKEIARTRKKALKVRTNQIFATEEFYDTVTGLLDILEEFETELLRNAGKK